MELLTLADREMHYQAIARATLWHRPYTLIIPGRMPVTYFRDRIPCPHGWSMVSFCQECRIEGLREFCSPLPCEVK